MNRKGVGGPIEGFSAIICVAVVAAFLLFMIMFTNNLEDRTITDNVDWEADYIATNLLAREIVIDNKEVVLGKYLTENQAIPIKQEIDKVLREVKIADNREFYVVMYRGKDLAYAFPNSIQKDLLISIGEFTKDGTDFRLVAQGEENLAKKYTIAGASYPGETMVNVVVLI